MEREKTIGGRKVIFRELSVGEIEGLLASFEDETLESKPIHMCDLLFPDNLPLSAVCLITGLERDFFETLLPSDYAAVLEAAEAVNPSLVEAVKRLARIGRAVFPGETLARPSL